MLCHGTPTADDRYLLEAPTPEGSVLRRAEEIAEALHGVAAPVICCAHTHIPRAVWTAPGQLIVNPGSVGMQAYDEGDHIMETGSPHARYAILHKDAAGWQVEHIAIPYDWEAAATAAERNGQPDRAHMQRTGRAR